MSTQDKHRELTRQLNANEEFYIMTGLAILFSLIFLK
jgi:hypothetical protein